MQHTAQATNAELSQTVARMIDGTAQRILYLIRQGYPYKLGRRFAAGKALLIIEGEALDIESWNIWIQETNNPEFQVLQVNEAEVALFDQDLSMTDVVNILRFKEDGKPLITIKGAVEIYLNAKKSGEESFKAFLDTIKNQGRANNLIA
jgi:hypothetical protein